MTGHWKRSIHTESSDDDISVELAVRILPSNRTFPPLKLLFSRFFGNIGNKSYRFFKNH